MTSTAPTELTMELLNEVGDSFNSGDADLIASYFTEDCVFYTARGPEAHGRKIEGRQALRDYLATRFGVIPDMHWEDKYQYISGNRAVSVWTVTGTSANGEVLNYQGCDLWEFRDGKVCSKDTYWKIVGRDY